jgi:hypothetical protein
MKGRWRGLLAGCLLVFLNEALSAEPSLFYLSTVGSDHYTAHDIDFHVALPRNYFISPNYNTFRSDLSDGRFHTYGGTFGRSRSGNSWRLITSHTPENALYNQTSIGGELTQRMLGDRDLNPKAPEFLARIRYTYRMHEEGFPTGGGVDWVDINQNEFLGGLITRWRETSLSLTYTQSAYNEDISALGTPTEVYQPLPGLSSVVGGYTDYAHSMNLSQKLAANWRVWTIWTRLHLKAGSTFGNSYIFGGGYYAKYLSLLVNYNLYQRTGQPTRNYISLGVGWEFSPE